MSEMLRLYESARCVSVPILVIRTADQNATVDAIRGVSAEHPMVAWDAARGLTDVNELGKAALAKAGIKGDETIGFVEAMLAALKLPPRSVVVAPSSTPVTTSAPLLSSSVAAP